MPSAMMRAIVSVEPPGASGTMMVTWRVGKSCAAAPPTALVAANARAISSFLIHFLPRLGYTLTSRLRPGIGNPTHARPAHRAAGTWFDDAAPAFPFGRD